MVTMDFSQEPLGNHTKGTPKSDQPSAMSRSVWRMRIDVNYQQEIDSSMTTHDSINLLMSFLKLEISEEL